MPIAYERATGILRANFEPGRTHGTSSIDDRLIRETGRYFVFGIGAGELIAGKDISCAIITPAPVVFKNEGHIEPRAFRRLSAAAPLTECRNPSPALQP